MSKFQKVQEKNGRPINWGSSCWAQRCFQSKAVEGLGTSCSWLKTAASNWYLLDLVIEKSNFTNLKITKPFRWQMEENSKKS